MVFSNINDYYAIGEKIYIISGIIIASLVSYRMIYLIIGIFFTRKFKEAKKKHKYAILIAARNEEKVIGNLLSSINKQDYPKDNITVFVVADNCNDNTAKISRNNGAICYERFNDKDKTKGFALQFLLNKIEEDYGRLSFEGYFIFDADNLLNKDYISKMNDAFDSGEKIITSYRNTKNFDENWIASNYALHWLRSIRNDHRARSVLRLATNIQGTGFLFASEIVKDGWKFTSLTEDRALSADSVVKGYSITYNDEAEFFDEQPTNLRIALRQRLRWSKGHLLAYVETAPSLIKNIIFGRKYIVNKTPVINNKFLESIRHRFASFDMLMHQTPFLVFNLFFWLFFSALLYVIYSYSNGVSNTSLVFETSLIGRLLTNIFKDIYFNFDPGIEAMFASLIIVLILRLLFRIETYLLSFIMPIYIFIIERKRIKKITFIKKIKYILTWPIFDLIGIYTSYIALFVKVTWKPIPHTSEVTIEDIYLSKK